VPGCDRGGATQEAPHEPDRPQEARGGGAVSGSSGCGDPAQGHRPLATRRPRELEVSASLAGFPRNKNRLSVTGTGWEPTPWRVRREALRRSNRWTAVTMSENIVRYLSQQASDGMPMAALHQR